MRPWYLVLAALILGATPFISAPAHADPYKWCAQYAGKGSGGGRNCGFVTYQQCMATVSGIGGFCEPNKFYTGRETTGSGARKSRKHRDD